MHRILNLLLLIFPLFLFPYCNNPASHEDDAISLTSCLSDENQNDSALQPINAGLVEEPCLSYIDTVKFEYAIVKRDTMTIKLLNGDDELIRNSVEDQDLLPGSHTILVFIGDLPSIYGVTFKSRSINQTYWIKK